ncbi:MAG: Rieske (2Fe-2S) protein [Halobacteriales archaeon]
MTDRYRLTDVDTVRADGSWLFTIRDRHGNDEEVILVPCDDEDAPVVRAWINRCTHEAQRLHREEVGAIIRDGEIVCPKHGSMFDTCSGYCGNGEAAETTLPSIDITIEDGQVYLIDEAADFLHPGGRTDDDEDPGPSSTSHLTF